MATKTHSYGTKLQYDLDGAGSYTDATDIKSIQPPKAKAAASETTHLESTAAWKEFIPGFLEAGEMSWTGYVHKTLFATFYTTIFVGRTTYYFRIQLPAISGETTGSKLDWQGFITECGWDDIEDEAVMYSATSQITGALTFTAGS